MAANKIVSTIGHHGFWGCSAGFNFLDLLPFTDNENIEEPLNILLVSPGDIRHIMYTVARRRRSGMKTRPINFYILEQPLEILAREIMLLQILFDFELPVRQRANTFLEVFGNCLLQERTYKYVSDLALQLYSFIAKRTSSMSSANNTEDVESFLENIIDLSCMKYKEIDTLCSIYHDRYGSAKKHTTVGTVRASRLETKLGTPAAPTVETTTNAMVALRDQRLRGYYAERFDARTALTDWDYYHHLKPTVAGIIHIKLFREWRVNGIAFEFGDQVYTHSNYTLFTFVAGVMKKGLEKGNAKEILGYWGDVVCSPYYSFGIDDLHSTISKYEDGLFEIMNKDTGTEQHRHNSIEIAVYNVLAMLYEIETGMRYKLHRANDIFSGLGTVDNITGETDVKEISTPKAVEDTSSSDNAAKDAADENDEVLKEYLPPIAEESENVEVVHETKKPQFTAEEIEARRLKAEEASMVAMLRKAETIVESLDGIKIFPMCGGTQIQEALSIVDNDYVAPVSDPKADANSTNSTNTPGAGRIAKPKFKNMFDMVYVGARSAQIVQENYFHDLLTCNKNDNVNASTSMKSVVAVEGAKYLIPLADNEKLQYDKKIEEYMVSKHTQKHDKVNLKEFVPMTPPPIKRRFREPSELEKNQDVLFYISK